MAISRSVLLALSAHIVIAEFVSPALEESDCGLSALQVQREARGTSGEAECDGEWCAALIKFCHLFDTNQPMQMQKAFDMYSDYANREEGIKLAVTKDHFYEMYHGNVGQKLSEFLPQKLFAWEFARDYETVEPSGPTEATVVRTGTVTFNLGYWKRNMFWNSVVKRLPKGKVFPYSTVKNFDDCTKCPAKLVLTLKKGGANGDVEKDWKVTGLSLIKLA